jgi:hypothetical protein
MPTEYLDRATAISVGQHWKASELFASLRDLRYERTKKVGDPDRGEYRWSTVPDGGAGAESTATKQLLSVHLIHEDRVLRAYMQVVGEAGEGEDSGDGDLEVLELRYCDGRDPPQAETSLSIGAEALIQAVLKADDAETGLGEQLGERMPKLSKTEVRALKVADLRVACAERALDTVGLKPVLAARLNAFEAQRGASGSACAADDTTADDTAVAFEAQRGASGSACAADDTTADDMAVGESEGPAHVVLYPCSHYTAGQEEHKARVLRDIATECESAVDALLANGQMAEAERLRYRTESDLADIAREGYCSGMENYSRHLTGRKPGEAPPTLLDYMPDDWLFIVDESHITVPQLGAMYSGDHSRKAKLVDGGFRLPSALDNRPLMGEEVWQKVPQAVLVSATPGAEIAMCGPSPRLSELVVRPTGIPDPQVSVVDVRPLGGYEDHLLAQIEMRIAKRERALVTCITKSSAEKLSEFLTGHGIKSFALHSGVKPLDRLRVLDDLREGKLDVLVGCNLLREGLDLPQVSLVCVLNADKQGLLRSTTSLIQTIGRAARHVNGLALLYTESGTTSDAMHEAIRETNRRRERQLAYNKENSVVPRAAGTILDAKGTTTKVKAQPKCKGGGSVLEMLSRDNPGGGGGGEDRGPPGGDLEGKDRELYDELRAWRGQVARAGRQRRPFMILTEAVMQGLAVARPSSIEDLLDVKGVGPKKAEMYGDAILQLVRSNGGNGLGW